MFVRLAPRSIALAALLASGCAPLGLYRPGTEDAPEIVNVTMTDTGIDVWPSLVARGKVTLEIRNDGQLEHAYHVTGPGTDEASEEFLTTGQHRRETYKLAPGTFRIFCPDGDHAKLGMDARLVVTERVGFFRR
jgi:hypothetical protein